MLLHGLDCAVQGVLDVTKCGNAVVVDAAVRATRVEHCRTRGAKRVTGGGEREAGEGWQVKLRGNMALPANDCVGSCV